MPQLQKPKNHAISIVGIMELNKFNIKKILNTKLIPKIMQS
jgi:hypothetical protein